MMISGLNKVKAPADVTPTILSDILSCNVSSCRLEPLGKGVMSNVQLLSVYYLDSAAGAMNDRLPSRYIVKFKKPEVPLPDLFPVEGEFYRLGELIRSTESCAFPFRLAKGFAAGETWLVLEYIPHSEVRTFEVYEGCPPDLFDDILVRLARMHSLFWIHDGKQDNQSELAAVLIRHSGKLSLNPGAGHTLPISTRQQSFLPAWPAVRARLTSYMDDCDVQQIEAIVNWAAADDRIEKCAKFVSDQKCTLVHGDFHIGNLLIPIKRTPSDEYSAASNPFLVDWSMAGMGNPLIDLVFFLVVGAQSIPCHDTDSFASSEAVKGILNQYQTALNDHKHTAQVLLLWDDLISMFRACLLNQFVILVCYDSLCREMANTFHEKKDVYHNHFDKVNVRCIRMLLSSFGWSNDMFG